MKPKTYGYEPSVTDARNPKERIYKKCLATPVWFPVSVQAGAAKTATWRRRRGTMKPWFCVPWIYIFVDCMQVFISPTGTSIRTLNFVWIYTDASYRIPWLYVHISINLFLVAIFSIFNQKSGVKKLTSVKMSYLLDSHVTHCVQRSIWWIHDGFPNPYCPYAKEHEYNKELYSFV